MKLRPTTDNALIIGIVLLLVTIIIVLGSTFYQSSQVNIAAKMVVRSNEILVHSEKILSLVVEGETSARGYVITGQKAYITPLNLSHQNIYKELRLFVQLIKDDAIQQQRVGLLKSLIDKRIAVSKLTVSTYNLKGQAAAMAIVQTGRGKLYTDTIRSIISNINTSENQLLAIRQDINAKKDLALNNTLSVLLVSIMVLLIFLIYKIRIDYLAKKEATLQLAKFNSQLNMTVEEKTKQLVKASRLYLFISQINQMIVRTTDKATLFSEACRIAVELGKFKLAWIGMLDDDTKTIIPVMHAGYEKEYLSKINVISFSNELPEDRGPIGTALSNGKYIICNDIENDPLMLPWQQTARDSGYQSYMALPIIVFGKVVGAVSFYATEKYFFDKQEIALLEEATGDVAFALELFEKDEQRKQIEQAVVASKRRYQVLAELAPVGIFHTDVNGSTTFVNPYWCEMTGLASEEALGNGWLNLVHDDDKAMLVKGWGEAIVNQKTSISEYRFVRQDGSIVWVIGQSIPEINADNIIIGYIGTITNITERKKAEAEIARINKEKETILSRISDSIISIDSNWRYTFLNDAALSTHPLGREETIGKIMWDVHPELVGSVFANKYYEALETQKMVEVESFYEAMGIWFMVKIYPSNDGLTIFYTDITKRKEAEIEIALSNERFELVAEATNNVIWEWDLQTDSIWWNNSFYSLFGYDKTLPQNINSRNDLIIHPEDKKRVLEGIQKVINSGQKNWDEEYRCISQKGEILFIYDRAFIVRDAAGNAQKMIGSMIDFTELKKANNEIVKEKVLSDKIINSLPGVFYLYTRQGKFLRWNKNFETVTKYNSNEIREISPLVLFDIDDQVLLKQKIENVFTTGEDNVNADFLTKTKEKIPYYFTGIAIEYEGNDCLMGVGIDVSEIVKAQEQIKQTTEQLRQLATHLQTIREEERKRIGREIHDELGQQLTAIKMDVAWIDKKTPDEPQIIKNKFKNIITLLDGSNQSIRRILSELRPGILDKHGLIDAIHWLKRQFIANTGIPVTFTASETEIMVDEPIANTIFRAYQEAFTNITRYANASKVVSSLTIINNQIVIIIEDDGIGFDVNIPRNKQSFGILGMKERVKSLDGEFKIHSSIGSGTTIIIKLPYKSL